MTHSEGRLSAWITGGSTSSASSADCGSGQLQAAGSTAQANAMTQWIKDFQAKCPGVTINYTSTYTSPFVAMVYLDVVNSAGQTVGVSIGSVNFSTNETIAAFVAFPSSGLNGTFTAKVFAVSNTGVPVSVTSSMNVTL